MYINTAINATERSVKIMDERYTMCNYVRANG